MNTWQLIWADATGLHAVNAEPDASPLNTLTTLAIGLQVSGSAKSVTIVEYIGTDIHTRYQWRS